MALIYVSVILLFVSSEDAFLNMMEGMVDVIEFVSGDKITVFTLVMTLIAAVFSLFARVLKIGACISLGQLSSNHKLLCSFGWYVGIYLVEAVIQGIYFFIRLIFEDYSSHVDYLPYFSTQWETTLLAGIISCVVFYILTWYVMSRKLNLD